jgi:hypothetical protein
MYSNRWEAKTLGRKGKNMAQVVVVKVLFVCYCARMVTWLSKRNEQGGRPDPKERIWAQYGGQGDGPILSQSYRSRSNQKLGPINDIMADNYICSEWRPRYNVLISEIGISVLSSCSNTYWLTLLIWAGYLRLRCQKMSACLIQRGIHNAASRGKSFPS